MLSAISADLHLIAQELGLPAEKVQRTVDLLDEGNTVAFITRYRKDQTGGLDEEQIRHIQRQATKLRLLHDRKQTILKSIESQGKLTPELREQIDTARSAKRLEDLYLPFKPKKQTLATLARQRGLEPLAREILEAAPAAADLDARAADFVSPDKHLNSVAEVLHGVGHLLAERFGERAEVRSRLREILQRTGQLVSTRIETAERDEGKHRQTPVPAKARPVPQVGVAPAGLDSTAAGSEQSAGGSPAPEHPAEAAGDGAAGEGVAAGSAEAPHTAQPPQGPAENAVQPRTSPGPKRLSAKERKRQRTENAFKDYFDYREALSRVPPHRVLALNRGERAKVLRVKVEGNTEEMAAAAIELLVPDNHPQADFLRACVRDALSRLVIPSLEREIRRELTDSAEEHAVGVFVRNLRKLLLQPPVRDRRVLAIDPGLRSGCQLAAVDEFGNVLEVGVVHAIGGEAQRAESRSTLADLVRRHCISVVAIGIGAGCREAEQLVAELLAGELKDARVAYVIVNEAGASVYSTSPIGREELPQYDAVARSAVSIARRLQDPLSELVKIDPANLGVGLYQHDVKAKHLRESLDAVVESCVNYVGVDVNTASPSLLRYVSGLNQLTARRLYEYRLEHGPFRNRNQLQEVPGIGEATFVQAAGFLKILGGDNPLDAAWIHPESYEVARRLLQKLNSSVDEFAGALGWRTPGTCAAPGPEPAAHDPAKSPPAHSSRPGESLAEKAARVDIPSLARELGIGQLLLKDLLHSLTKPGRDPRDELPPPLFRTRILKLEDLRPGMELSGHVLNVVDFGAFVDIGTPESALVHISRLSDRYVRDPHEVVSVGDILTVWVVDVDKERRRVSLTAIRPAGDRKGPPGRRGPEATVGARQGRRSGAPAEQRGKPLAKPRPAGSGRPAKHRSASRPKPRRPITDAMVQGREPMRSFSDLLQYFEKKQQASRDEGSSHQ